MERRMRLLVLKASVCICGLVLLGAPLLAKDKDAKASRIEVDSGAELSADLAFRDVDSNGSILDWGADSGGPELGFEAWARARFSHSGLAWLRTGPEFEASARLDTEVSVASTASTETDSVATNPFLVADGMDARGLAGWGADASFRLGTGKLELGLGLLGGLCVLDLTGSDTDYLPSGADATDFWFRVEPSLAVDASLSYDLPSLELSAENRYLAAWDSENAYGEAWAAGFEEKAEFGVAYKAFNSGSFDWRARAIAKYSLESRLIEPVRKIALGLRSDLKWKDFGKLAVSPLVWTDKAKIPDLSAMSSAEDIERQLSAKLEWESPGGSGSWSCSLEFPWAAWSDGEAISGTWELGLSWRL
jgi:hypothetical protein